MRFCWVTFLVLSFITLTAQTPAYLHYTLQDGLPSNLVYCGLQDQRGLLWFGTDKGLACFDGIRFRVYGVADGLPDPEVLNMKEDSKGRLWLFCFRKKPCYMLNGRIITEKQDSLLAQLEFHTGMYILSDGLQGRQWLAGHTRRIYCIDGDSLFSTEVKEGSYVRVLENKDGVLAMGTTNFGRIDFKREFKELVTIQNDPRKIPFISAAVSGSAILYSFSNKLLLFEWKNGQVKEVGRRLVSRGNLSTDLHGRFWHCSSTGGAICFDNPNRTLENPVTYLPDKKVNYMFEDRQGTLWFCMSNDGLYALPQNAPLKYLAGSDAPSRNIRSLVRMPEGQMMIGNDIGQVNILKEDKITVVEFDPKREINQVRQVIPASNTAFWVATDKGLYFYDWNNRQKNLLYSIQFSIKGILKLRDTIWSATHGTLHSYALKTQTGKIWLYNRTTTVGQDSDGNVWAGSINGIFSKKDSFQINWGDTFPELKSRIVTIQNAGNHQLWVITPDLGLLKVIVKSGRVVQVSPFKFQPDKPITNIQALFVAPNGDLWMATNQGVYGRYSNGRTVHYSIYDGLADNDVNAVYVYKDTLWAGTAAGLSRIDMKANVDSIAFQSLFVNLRYQQKNQLFEFHLLDSLQGARQITLPADVTNIDLDLTGLDFRSRGNMAFEIVRSNALPPIYYWTFPNLLSWIATGFSGKRDTNLVNSGAFSLGSFLPPGKYEFDLTAIKASGTRSSLPDRWTILKTPFWYETLWFYLAIWLLVVYSIWRLYRARIAYREVNASAAILQLQALQSQMNPHFIGNAVNAIQQFLHPPNPEKTSEYISMFMGLLRRTMHFSEQTFISFEEELKYDLDYLKLVELRFEDRFDYEIIGAQEIPANTPIPSMLLQPIMENATLHGISPKGKSKLRLEFKIVNDQFFCTMTDNGLGLLETQRQKQLAGVERESKGLAILHKKIKTLNILYNLGMSLEVQDLSEIHPTGSGTRATLCYALSKIWKAKEKLKQQSSIKGQ